MKTERSQSVDQPAPFTPRLTRELVRNHAFELYRDKLLRTGHLSLEDWVLAEKDLVAAMEAEESLAR